MAATNNAREVSTQLLAVSAAYVDPSRDLAFRFVIAEFDVFDLTNAQELTIAELLDITEKLDYTNNRNYLQLMAAMYAHVIEDDTITALTTLDSIAFWLSVDASIVANIPKSAIEAVFADDSVEYLTIAKTLVSQAQKRLKLTPA